MYYDVDEKNSGWYWIDNIQEMSWYVNNIWMLTSIDLSGIVGCIYDHNEWLILRVGCYHMEMQLVYKLIT